MAARSTPANPAPSDQNRDPAPREYADRIDGSPTISAELADVGVSVVLTLPYAKETIRLSTDDARAFGGYLLFLADNAA